MKRYLLLLLTLAALPASATHIRGGFIQTRLLAANQYEATITVYFDNAGGSAAAQLATSTSLCWGDGNTENLPRLSLTPLPNNPTVLVVQFRAVHTYAGPGNYALRSVILNRTATNNMINTIQIPFCLQTDLQITNQTGQPNQPPVLTTAVAAGARASAGQPITLPFRATDADGDSLAYTVARPLLGELPCKTVALSPEQYQYPNAISQRGTYRLNAQTGELVWNAPTAVGLYTAAVYVSEFRRGLLLSRTYHEITVLVEEGSGGSGTIPPYEAVNETATNLILATASDAPETPLQLLVAPNPVADEYLTATILCTVCAEGTLLLHDLTGRVVQQTALNPVQGRDQQRLDVRALSPGVYLLRVEMAGRQATQKVLKR